MENKKTKLTISGNAKKSIKNIEIAKSLSKNSVVIEKSKNNYLKKGKSFKNSGPGIKTKSTSSSFGRSVSNKSSLGIKNPNFTNDFEKRKLA